MRHRKVIAFGLFAVLGLGVLAFPAGAWLTAFVGWTRDAGMVGVLAFAVAYFLCALLLIPGWPLRVGAGLVYGPALGFAVAAPLTFAAATLAFLVGRSLFRGPIARRIARDPRLAAVDAAIAENGLWIVLLLRLSPLFPNELVNYGLGATRVRVRDYALASFLGLVPLTATYTWLGSLLTRVSDLESARPRVSGALGQALWWVGLFATVGTAVALARLAGRALDRRLGPAPPALAPEADASLS
ncbi:MAG TPA: TVP38/TMEM64 family protein [Anaeromyxobacteraceae bacterium]|nr:TVP38/TMEM64 family protein [Anaeromyxobacteraceae bacterium]